VRMCLSVAFRGCGRLRPLPFLRQISLSGRGADVSFFLFPGEKAWLFSTGNASVFNLAAQTVVLILVK